MRDWSANNLGSGDTKIQIFAIIPGLWVQYKPQTRAASIAALPAPCSRQRNQQVALGRGPFVLSDCFGVTASSLPTSCSGLRTAAFLQMLLDLSYHASTNEDS
jgi:hypothetical protein